MFESDHSANIHSSTAVTEIFPDGQRVTALILEYDRVISSRDLRRECFSVEDHFDTGVYPTAAVAVNGGVIVSPRRILRVYANSRPEPASDGMDGRYVILELSPEDEAAFSLYFVGEHRACRAHMKKLRLLAVQSEPITALDGSTIAPQAGVYSSAATDPVADRFIQGEFEGLSYHLYIPSEQEPGRRYPLVQFIGDSWDVGPDPAVSLAQGWGGVVWAFPQEQAKRPCFVLCPHFPGPTIIEDDYQTRPELETAARLLEYIIGHYCVDRSRIYHTGQSMGAMAALAWAARKPETFAALLLMSGTGDPETVGRLKKMPIWLLASEADGRGAAILNRTADALESVGGRVGRYDWDGRMGLKALNERVRAAANDDSTMRLTLFKADSVVPCSMRADGGSNHRGTWMLCYQLEALREWLFDQRNETKKEVDI